MCSSLLQCLQRSSYCLSATAPQRLMMRCSACSVLWKVEVSSHCTEERLLLVCHACRPSCQTVMQPWPTQCSGGPSLRGVSLG
jgi:hypothetical protein